MTAKDQREAQARQLLARLRAEHEVLKHFRPLDEDEIENALIQAHPDSPAWLIRLALHHHLTCDAYLQSLSHGGPRHALDGSTHGEVDVDTRHHARNLLKHHHSHRGSRLKTGKHK